MRLTFVALSSQYIHLPLAPFCLKKVVEEACPDCICTIADVNINEPREDVLRRILQTKPTAVCFSVYIWNREMTALMIRRIKAVKPDITVLMGGPEVTWDVENALQEMPADYLLRGAGEESLPRLVQHLMKGQDDPAAIPGVCFKTVEGFHIGEVAPTPPPRSDLYEEDWQQVLNGRMVYAETSRGCPFSCAFCLSGHREAVQFMPAEEAIALLIRLGQTGTDTVKLIDRTFNCHPTRTKAILRGLMEAKTAGQIGNVCYHMEVAADIFDEETLCLLQEAPAGLFQMEAGLQSFHGPTLDACHRHTDMDKLQRNLGRILAGGNIHLHIDLIAGLPEEDFATFGDSFDKAFWLHPHQLQLGYLKVIHGSALRDGNWGARFSPDPPYEILSTPWLSYEELVRLKDCAEAVEKISNSGRFARTVACVLKATGWRPFDLFLAWGDRLGETQGKWSLDRLTRMVYDTALGWGVPEGALRDALVQDRLATDNTGYLPPFLQGDGAVLKQAGRNWRLAHPAHRHPRMGLSADGKTLFIATWQEKHPVTAQGAVQCLPIEEELL